MAQQENDIDSLARMVAEGFKAAEKNVNERFDQVDERFEEMHKEMDKRFDGLEKEVRQVHQRIDQVVMPMLDDHSRRIKDIETTIA